MYDLIIIGAGPAGISASLYAKRANINVLVLYCGKSNLEKASQIDNYYGFERGISGEELYNNGIKQAKNLGVEIKDEEVLDIEQTNDEFNVVTTLNKYEAKAIIISTGSKIQKPNIDGINEYEGKGISYCAVCDGFFYRNRNVVVIGDGKFALNEARELSHIADKVTILTNGHEFIKQDEFEVNTKTIKMFTGQDKIEEVVFEDDERLKTDGVFIALGQAGGFDFAKRLGILIKDNSIKVNDKMETNIPGVYACGNLTGGLLQISKAVYEGAQAGINAAEYIRSKNN